jgi:MYXO-CTERM domain-containing protein
MRLSCTPLVVLTLALTTLGRVAPSYAGPAVNCPSGFAPSGACAVGIANDGQHDPFLIIANGGGSLSGSTVILQPSGVSHNPNSLMYQTEVNVQAFTTTFTFVLNGWNVAFVLTNSNNQSGFNGSQFSSGAGCEGGFYQAFSEPSGPPNNVFALDFEAGNFLSPSAFTYSNVQIYQQGADPCLPADGTEPYYYATNKVSTFPVALTSPVGTRNTYTGDTYSATVTYTGTNVVLSMYDVTAGGTCAPTSSTTCFTYTWNGVSIPSWVDGTTAWAGFTAATNAASTTNLDVDSWVYTVLSPAAMPTLSPAGGAYASTQSVTISDSSPGAIVCYNTTGAPATDGGKGCANGTLYTGAISVPSGRTVYAVAGGAGYGDSAIGSSAYQIGSTASQPTFYPASGKYQGNQTVFLASAQGSVICYDTTGSPATNGSTGCTAGKPYTGPITVSSDETLYAVAGGKGFTESALGSSTYAISPYASTYSGKLYTPANSPTFSPLPGAYSDTQSVTLSTSTSGANICYVLSNTAPALFPEPNSRGGCSVGTLYSGPVTVSSSQTLYAAAGTTLGAFVEGSGPPSSVVAGAYVIGETVSTPTFAPAAGTYGTAQLVTISDATSGAAIYYTVDGTTPTSSSMSYTGPIHVSSTETLKAIAAASGYKDSPVAVATYTIEAGGDGGRVITDAGGMTDAEPGEGGLGKSPSGGGSGCGCRTAGTTPSGLGVGWGLAFVGAIVGRRRPTVKSHPNLGSRRSRFASSTRSGRGERPARGRCAPSGSTPPTC